MLPGKVFKLGEKFELASLINNFQGYQVTEKFVEDQYEFDLVTEFTNLVSGENSLTGLYFHDIVTTVYHRGKAIPTPKTIEAFFNFTTRKEDVLLTILQDKWTAGRIANEFSKIIFDKKGYIFEAEIPPDALQTFHELNPEGTKVAFFDGIGIPNLNKLSLYGPDLIETDLFDEYSTRGNLWYIVITSKKRGHVVGITRNAIIVIFNKVSHKEYLDYVIHEVFPLILT